MVKCWVPEIGMKAGPEAMMATTSASVVMLSRFRIGARLAIAATLLTLFAIVAVSGAAIVISSSALKEKSFDRLSAIADGRRNQLQSYLEAVRLDLKGLSANRDTINAVKYFSSSWVQVGDDPKAILQDRYITGNPNAVGQKDELLFAESGDQYDSLHRKYHPGFREHLKDHGYYDIFLFNKEGDVVYSVFKERDFSTNLIEGEWASSGLGRAYRAAMELETNNKFAFDDFAPYGPSDGAPATFMATPIVDFEGQKVGVLALQLPVEKIAALLSGTTGLGETGETLLIKADGMILTDSMKTEVDETLKVRLNVPGIEELSPDNIVTAEFDGYRDMHADIALAEVPFANARWTVGAIMDDAEILKGIASLRNTIAMIALAVLAIAIALAVMFARSLSRPIALLVGQMKDLADGDTRIEPEQDRRDEIGDMARSVAVFRDAAIDKARLEAEAEDNRSLSEKERAEREAAKAEETARMQEAVDALGGGLTALADGNLTVRLDRPFMENLDGLRLNFNSSVEKLNQTLGGIRDISSTLDSNAQEVRSATDDLSRRTEQQAAALEETSAALEEITATIGESSRGAGEMTSIAKLAKTDTDTSADVVQRAATAMADIETASKEIASIIDVIEDIAFQTNLLALNAGVEAARAGEAGQGFAVVAQEVRELAQRTTVAAKEIKELITKSGERVANGGELVRATRDALEKIAEHVTEIDGRISAIATASNEQLTGVQEINSAVGQIDEVTQQNAAMVEETTAVSHSLAGDANSLTRMIGEFSLSDGSSGRPAEAFGGTKPASRAPRATNASDEDKAKQQASPARKLVDKLTGAFSSKGSAAVAADAEWAEF
ncbi:hypothetical protein B7H23_03520 [Notoacmeibacter marinus]|uniref:Methyl-accepting chemotaxis protein n=2 Tax=Notoacmeibacter marinus TaxID=1876515 RepID=A0A231V1F2_9HYPH|nr:hypothetical protein B7H23_03520 [Notoacmeibacter marinus]